MSTKHDLFAVVKNAEARYWRESALWIGFTLVGGLMPLWGGAIILALPEGSVPWQELIKHGELSLYSAALVAPALYIVVNERFTVPFPSRAWLVLAGLVLILSAAFLYGGVTALNVGVIAVAVEDNSVIGWSTTIFLLSLAFVFVISLVENVRIYVNPQTAASARQHELEKRFDDLRGDDE